MKKNTNKWIFIFIGAILLIFTTYYVYDSLNYRANLTVRHRENQPAHSSSPKEEKADGYKDDIGATTNVINILFLGIDKDEGRESWLGVYRSDTIAIARLYIDSKKIKVLSIPRDTYAYIPVENKFDRINHAYAFGSANGNGVQAVIDAVNHLFNKKMVDYYFLMNMEPIPSIVDELGGVKLDVEIDMKDHDADLSKGLQVLNGRQAFDYIHWRYSAGGDIDRIKRQQKFISALYKQQRDSGKILETLQIVLKHNNDIKTDFTMKQMIGLATFMSDIPDGNVNYYTIPGSGKMIGGISYWIPNESNTEEVLKEFFQ